MHRKGLWTYTCTRDGPERSLRYFPLLYYRDPQCRAGSNFLPRQGSSSFSRAGEYNICNNTGSVFVPSSSCQLLNFRPGGSKAGTTTQPWPGEHHLCCHLTLFQAIQANLVWCSLRQLLGATDTRASTSCGAAKNALQHWSNKPS